MPSNTHPDRRTFLATVGAAGALGSLVGATAAEAASPPVHPSNSPAAWDMSWLDRLTGKHKQVFDVGSLGIPLVVVANYLNAFEEVYRLRHPDVNTVIGIGGHAFPINANDATWAAWKLGERHQVKDPDTGTWAVRNIYYDNPPKGTPPAATVKALQARGTIFWMCNNALNFIAGTYAAESKRPVEDVRKELILGFNPGVILVPAHTMLIGLCQEHGCSYEAL